MPDGKKISIQTVKDIEAFYDIEFVQYVGYKGKIRQDTFLIDFIVHFENESTIITDIFSKEKIEMMKAKNIKNITFTFQNQDIKLSNIVKFLEQKYINTSVIYVKKKIMFNLVILLQIL